MSKYTHNHPKALQKNSLVVATDNLTSKQGSIKPLPPCLQATFKNENSILNHIFRTRYAWFYLFNRKQYISDRILTRRERDYSL